MLLQRMEMSTRAGRECLGVPSPMLPVGLRRVAQVPQQPSPPQPQGPQDNYLSLPSPPRSSRLRTIPSHPCTSPVFNKGSVSWEEGAVLWERGYFLTNPTITSSFSCTLSH